MGLTSTSWTLISKGISWVPQGRLDANATTDFKFCLGAAYGFNETPVFTPFMTYDGDVNY
jgi:hypothetical protein